MYIRYIFSANLGGQVSVRSSLLAILTMGEAYGFQLHGELRSRTAGRRTVNVGQVYATLERLTVQGAIESAGVTDDGLPLYRLTRAGLDEANAWLDSTTSGAGDEWPDMVDRILIVSSLPQSDPTRLVSAYRSRWLEVLAAPEPDPGSSGQEYLNAAATGAQAAAALAWLDTVAVMLAPAAPRTADTAGRPADFQRSFSTVRPKRGRRPTPPGEDRQPAAPAGP